MVRLLGMGPPLSPSPEWVERFLNTVLFIDEIAVHPRHQHMGIARALLADLHEAFLAHVDAFRHQALSRPPFLRENAATMAQAIPASVATHASKGAQPFFAALGYTVGPPRTPVPPLYLAGLTTTWLHEYDHVDGAFCFRQL